MTYHILYRASNYYHLRAPCELSVLMKVRIQKAELGVSMPTRCSIQDYGRIKRLLVPAL